MHPFLQKYLQQFALAFLGDVVRAFVSRLQDSGVDRWLKDEVYRWVAYVEGFFGPGHGDEKRAEVMRRTKEASKERGKDVSGKTIDALIVPSLKLVEERMGLADQVREAHPPAVVEGRAERERLEREAAEKAEREEREKREAEEKAQREAAEQHAKRGGKKGSVIA